MRPRFFTDRNLGKQFATLLRDAGVEVVAHDDRFPQNTLDEEWLPRAGREGWVVLTRDKQIRWRANQRDLVMEHRVALLALSGTGRTADLATLVVENLAAVERFLVRHPPPFIAKVLPPATPRRARPGVTARSSPGTVTMWLTEAQWRAER